jgi:hypothetical protein
MGGYFNWRRYVPLNFRLYRSAAGGWYLNIGRRAWHITRCH